jgi:hypothetical protein
LPRELKHRPVFELAQYLGLDSCQQFWFGTTQATIAATQHHPEGLVAARWRLPFKSLGAGHGRVPIATHFWNLTNHLPLNFPPLDSLTPVAGLLFSALVSTK